MMIVVNCGEMFAIFNICGEISEPENAEIFKSPKEERLIFERRISSPCCFLHPYPHFYITVESIKASGGIIWIQCIIIRLRNACA